MKKFLILLMVFAVGVTAVSLVPSTTSGQKNKIRKAQNPIPNRYIIVLDPVMLAAKLETSDKAANGLAESYGGKVDQVYSTAIQGFSAEMSPQEAASMSGDSRVLLIEEDADTSISGTQSNAPWGLDRVDQRTVPLNTSYNYAQTGTGVNVYVLDTGIRTTHAEFGGRATAVFDSVGDAQTGVDCNGHGTHVAGTIGGVNYGVAKNVNLHSVRVMDCDGRGTVSAAIKGIDWVTANHISPAVANMSLGSNSPSSTMDAAVANSIASGVTFVLAAGNLNADACLSSPARTPQAITVGASSSLDDRAGFSNFGSCVDIFAPGVGITSAWLTDDTSARVLNGTSMASPHVAGAAALYLETNRTANPAEVAGAIKTGGTTGRLTNMDAASPNLLLFTNPSSGPTAGGASVEGSVVTPNGRGIKNVTVVLQNAGSSEFRSAITNAFGYFRFTDVEVGSFYTMSVQAKRYRFENNTYSFGLIEDVAGFTFVGVRP